MNRRVLSAFAALGMTSLLFVASQSLSAPKALDIVDLSDGSQIVGIVTKQEPGKYIAIVTASGEQHMIPWSRLKPAPTPSAPPTASAVPVAAPPPPPPPPPAPKPGVIVLKDKTKVQGNIVRQEPGQYVIIDLPDGSEKTIPWDRISEVNVMAAKPQPAPAPSPAPHK
jgi:hypothetical protein